MKKYQLVTVIIALLGIVSIGVAHTVQRSKRKSGDSHQAHIIVTPDQIKFGPAPPALPAGAEVAVVEGDPSKPGALFVLRLKLPDGCKVMPHWHPTDEKVLVLQGVLGVGMGDKFDEAAGQQLPVGSYASMPKGVRHYAWGNGETIVQVSGIGPFEIHYVNPADDPRKK